MDRVLAEARFNVSCDDLSEQWILKLFPSGCFDYGNGTAVEVLRDGHWFDSYDTRYDDRFCDPRDFEKSAEELLRGIVRKDATVEKVLFRYMDKDVKFQIGKWYGCADSAYSPIQILRRTKKMLFVKNDIGVQWRMRIRVDEFGNEYLVDSTASDEWKDTFTYRAIWEDTRD